MQSRRAGRESTPVISGLTIETVSCYLEDLLESDDLFVDYLNKFLCIPTFPEPLFYNKRTWSLEVRTDEQKQQLAARIRSAFCAARARYGQSCSATKATNAGISWKNGATKTQDMVTTEFTVKTLDREQGIQWLKERRIPLFINSDFYFEYRLAKMLSQTDVTSVRQKKVDLVEIDTNDSILDKIRHSNFRLEMMIQENDGQPGHSEVKMNFDTGTSGSWKFRPLPSTAQQLPLPTTSSNLKQPFLSRLVADQESEVTVPQSTVVKNKYCNNKHHSQFLLVEDAGTRNTFPTSNLSSGVVTLSQNKSALKAAEKQQSHSSFKQSKENESDLNLEMLTVDNRNDDDNEVCDFGDEKTELSWENKKKLLLKRWSGILEFKKFLQGTSGEKVWNLWIDIERGKKIADKDELKWHLIRMKEKYIIAGAVFELTPESKSQLGLLVPSNWNMDHMARIQDRVALPLLCYWGPRYLLQLENRLNLEAVDLYKEYMKLKALPEADPFPKVLPTLPHRPRSCQKKTPSSAVPRLNGGNLMEANATSGAKVREESNQRMKLNSVPRKRPQTVPYNNVHHRSDLNQNKHLSKENPFREEKHVFLRESFSQFHKTTEKEQSGGSGKISVSLMSGLERLLQTLACEQSSGKFLRNHIEKLENQFWKHCLIFWESCQEYHKIFFEEPFKPELLAKKAKYLFSQFVGPGAVMDILCSKCDADDIHEKLDPPFEELFDRVEEYAIGVLYDAWESAVEADLLAYSKILKQEEKRSPGEKSAVVASSQRKGIAQIRRLPQSNDEGLDADLFLQMTESLPPDLRDFTLQRILSNRMELENFCEFLSDNYASLDLHCWMDIENYRRIPEHREVLRSSKADFIKETYLNRRYFFGPNSPASREEQARVIACGSGFGSASNIRPTDQCLYAVQKYVQHRLEFKWVPLFLSSKAFGKHRQSRVSINHVIDDALAQQKRKSRVVSRMLNSKWIPTTEKITQLRQALLNPLTSTQFMKFVSVRGNRLENNVLFWQEVQKFKDMCHSSSDKTLICQKASVIITCFLRSTIPPTIQITVGPELAEQTIRANDEQTSPYVFKDAQKRVFLDLLPHWDDFCAYREKLAFCEAEDDPLESLVNERKNDLKQMRRKKQRQLEEKRDKENARRQALLTTEHQKRVEKKWSVVWSDEDDLDSEFGFIRGKPISWSYSKYLAAFRKEQVLTRTDLPVLCGIVDASHPTKLPQVTNDAENSENGETGSLGDDPVSILNLNNAELRSSFGHQISTTVF